MYKRQVEAPRAGEGDGEAAFGIGGGEVDRDVSNASHGGDGLAAVVKRQRRPNGGAAEAKLQIAIMIQKAIDVYKRQA